MDWKNWKTWLMFTAALLVLFAIYSFAAPDQNSSQSSVRTAASKSAERPRRVVRTVGQKEQLPAAPEGVEPLRTDLLEPHNGSYRSDRDLFRYYEPPPPPTPRPSPPPTPVPAADGDKDGVADYQDNCPTVANPDQTDIDRNGIGAVCQPSVEIPPPPPLPPFTYKYLGTFGTGGRPIAAFSNGEQIVNVRIGETFGGRFILRKIGIESVEIGFVGFPPDRIQRVAVGATP